MPLLNGFKAMGCSKGREGLSRIVGFIRCRAQHHGGTPAPRPAYRAAEIPSSGTVQESTPADTGLSSRSSILSRWLVVLYRNQERSNQRRAQEHVAGPVALRDLAADAHPNPGRDFWREHVADVEADESSPRRRPVPRAMLVTR